MKILYFDNSGGLHIMVLMVIKILNIKVWIDYIGKVILIIQVGKTLVIMKLCLNFIIVNFFLLVKLKNSHLF